jgi:hypothetical protein
MKNTANRTLSIRRTLARILIVLLPIVPVLAQQQSQGSPQAPATPPSSPSPQPGQPASALPAVQGLKLITLAGKGEMNDLERHVMAPLVIEVLDQNERPVEGAEVVFRFPINGPGAVFTGGKTSQTARTNGQGQAAAMNWTANNQTGAFDVHVTATYGNQLGETTVSMSNVNRIVEESKNVQKNGGWWSPRWVKLAILGGTVALAAGVVLATRGSGSPATTTAAPPTVTITPGPPTVGGHP